jgi:2'-5' RNA ligase
MNSSGPSSVRLFLALWPTDAVRDALEAHAAGWSWSETARRTRTDRLHITLHFLGDVPTPRVPDLETGLSVPWAGCEIRLDRPTVWPGGIAVLESRLVPPELARLHGALAEKLVELEVPLEARRYRPHVTLARKAFGSRPPPDLSPLGWQAGPSYELVRSLPGGRGYETVQCFG